MHFQLTVRLLGQNPIISRGATGNEYRPDRRRDRYRRCGPVTAPRRADAS